MISTRSSITGSNSKRLRDSSYGKSPRRYYTGNEHRNRHFSRNQYLDSRQPKRLKYDPYENRSFSGRRDRYYDKSSSHTNSSSTIDDEIGHFDGLPGDVIRDRYVIKCLMGKGTFGKVFRCLDRKYNDQIALKVVRKVERYVDSARIEGDLLDDIYDNQLETCSDWCVKMFKRFELKGHYMMVFEPLGLSLYDIVRKNDYKRFPVPIVKQVTRQLMSALEFLQSINLIHTDLKLENVLFVHSSLTKTKVRQEGQEYEVSVPINPRIKLIDFGGATYDDDPKKSRIINTRQYRGPEVTLEMDWSFPSDIWSAGCIISEIFSGDLLFQTHEELEHLALIEKICGDFPAYMLHRSPHRKQYFDRDNKVRFDDLSRSSKKYVEEIESLESFFLLEESDRDSGVAEFVRDLLQVDPLKRLTAKEALTKDYKFLRLDSEIMIAPAVEVVVDAPATETAKAAER